MVSPARAIRHERSFEGYSRGAELVRAILALWGANRRIPYCANRNQQINDNLDKIRTDFDLTLDEWHYWAERARSVQEGV